MTMTTTTTTTAALDALARALAGRLPPELGWQLAGWAAHLRGLRHPRRIASSWARHRLAFGRIEREAQAVTVAACLDCGMAADDAVALIHERVAARSARDDERRAARSRVR